MKKIAFALLLLSGIFSPKLFSQQNDFGMWNTLSFEYKISQKLSIVAVEEFRLKENLSKINLFYTNLGVSYKLNEYFKISPVYRFIQKAFDDGSFGLKHRLMLDITYKRKISIISFTTRTRLQGELAFPGTDPLGYIPEYYWRQKFDFKFDISSSRFTPYVGMEMRVQFYNPRIKEHQGFGFDRIRSYIGCDYVINKSNALGIYYLTQFDFQVNDPTTLFILGLEYSFMIGGGSKNYDTE